MLKLKIKRGDHVIVITGKDRGKTGKVLKVLPQENKVFIAGVNVVKKHMKPTKGAEGGIIQKELAIHVSNIAHLDPKTKLPTKVGFKLLETGLKVRFAKKSGEIIAEEGK